MRNATIILLSLAFMGSLIAQNPMKEISSQPYIESKPLQLSKDLRTISNPNRLGGRWTPNSISSVQGNHESVKSFSITGSGSMWIEFHQNDLWNSRLSVTAMMEKLIPVQNQNELWALDWKVINEKKDDGNLSHIRIQQTLEGHPIHRQDMVLHVQDGSLRDLNGFAWTGPLPKKLPAPLPAGDAIEAARHYLSQQNVSFQSKPQFEGINIPEDDAQLVWYPNAGNLSLAYEINLHPNMMDHWSVYMDAATFQVLEAYSQLCSLAPLQLYDLSCYERCKDHETTFSSFESNLNPTPVLDGPTIITDQDLAGQNRTVNGYLVGSNFFMIDASRNGMYNNTQSVMPNEPVGVVWTIDGQNGSPTLPNFELIHVTNTNNNWKNLEVSAHFNGGEAYEYFRQKFNRNSINGSGGNIVSIINVADENGNDMDNAFWNGAAMFYGNGDVAFNAPLAKALDVAGHEMSHGVIQNTANLEYIGQSGALNESYADIFGAMIDRDDWKMGEDVTNSGIFPTGAIRDLSNPNNGGSGPGSPGWQPKHMNEFQNLPNTPQGDNGGVHVNSGIPNRAFFLLATSIGRDKAEQIYYKALTDYLVKSSQFIDMRNSAELAAKDLHGAGSTEVLAVRSAFDGVGIGSGQGDDYEEDIEVNSGSDFILATDENQSDLYWVPPTNPAQFVKMNVPAPISRPSFTDDGSACIYVNANQDMIVINFDWTQGLSYQWDFLESNPQGIWRNAVVSKDGSKIAYTTANLRNEIAVFDFNSGGNSVLELFNPTSATGGINTGDVLYPDVMEWDYSGEKIMYDALNRIESTFGDGIEYWDISFVNAWDKTLNDFGSGQITKLFSALPENISIGNASFSKNSPYIITFDYLESYFDIFGQTQTDYLVLAANIESGEVNTIYMNTTVGYPSYSKLDDKILFTFKDGATLLLATIDIQSGNKTIPVSGSEVSLINGAQKGVWFSTGERELTATDDGEAEQTMIRVYPQPARDVITISGDDLDEQQSYALYDLTGRAIASGKLSSAKTIQVEGLTPGTYVLRLINDKGAAVHTKVVKQ